MKLAERMKELRKERSLSQENIAKELAMSTRTYGRYEAGEREPTASVLIRMADFYAVTIDYLVGRSDKRR